MNNYFTRNIKPLALTTLLCAGGVQADSSFVELNKELEIMSGVIHTSLKQNAAREGIRYRALDATYLRNQGVVFEVKTSGNGSGWSALSDVLSVIPTAPLPPVAVISGDDYEFEYEVGEEWEHIAEDAIRQVEESFRETHAELRELRSREREIAWEHRELERRKRDLEFEQRQAQGEREQDIRSDLQELQQEMAQLDKREQELRSHADRIEKEQQEKLAKRQAATAQAYKTFLAGFEASVGEALCRFGAGLRELPDSEHISFVLKDFSVSDSRDKSDRVYVFSKQQVKSCSQEKLTSSELLASAEVYEF